MVYRKVSITELFHIDDFVQYKDWYGIIQKVGHDSYSLLYIVIQTFNSKGELDNTFKYCYDLDQIIKVTPLEVFTALSG